MTSAPPPPSIVSLPEPVVIVLADDEPVTVNAELIAEASRLSKLATLTVSPVVWSDSGADGEIDRGDTAARGQNQRIGARAAVDRGLRAAIGDAVVAAAGIDGVSARRHRRWCRRRCRR